MRACHCSSPSWFWFLVADGLGLVADLFSSPTKALSSDAREHNDCRAVFGIQRFMPRFFMVEDLA